MSAAGEAKARSARRRAIDTADSATVTPLSLRAEAVISATGA
jgi:hypothetical protein